MTAMHSSHSHPRVVEMLFWGLLAGYAVPVRSETVAIRLDRSADRLQVVLLSRASVESGHDADGREVLIRFPHAAEISRLDELIAAAPDWIENASSGYDTLLLRAAREVEMVNSKRVT